MSGDWESKVDLENAIKETVNLFLTGQMKGCLAVARIARFMYHFELENEDKSSSNLPYGG